MENQLNDLSKGDKASDSPNRYKLRSKKKGGKPDVPDWPTREERSAEDVASNNKERKTHKPHQ
jgi:hypothetical protein